MWKRAVIAVALAFAMGPALASDGASSPLAPAGDAARSGTAADLSCLSARVESLEQRVARIGRTAPNPDGRVALGERQAEFLKHVWAN
jgi:hypothetical protein